MARGTHGTLHDVQQAIDRIPDQLAPTEAVATLALEQAVNENPAAAATLQAAWEAVREKDSGQSGRALEMIAVTRAVLGEFGAAAQITGSMEEPESRVWPLWNMTSMLAEAGHTNEALALAEKQSSAHPKLYAMLGTAQGILANIEAEEKSRAGKK